VDGAGQGLGIQVGLAHVHLHGAHLAVGDIELEVLDAGGRLHGNLVFGNGAGVVEVLGCAADDVACHGAGAAVAVEHAHFRVRHVGGLHQGDAVGADAVVPVALGDAQGFGAI